MSIEAAHFAARAHASQMRKYTGEPYIYHPGRVASRTALLSYATREMVAAAWLHDTIEDCGVSPGEIRLYFGPNVRKLVCELTNPSKMHTQLTREARKQMDRDHLRGVSREAKAIKMLDRIDNLREMTNAPADFRQLYCKESRLLLDVVGDADAELAAELVVAIGELLLIGAYASSGPTASTATLVDVLAKDKSIS